MPVKMNKLLIAILILSVAACTENSATRHDTVELYQPKVERTGIVILGTVQDAGSPQIGCKKKCCAHLFDDPDPTRRVSSLGLIDADNHKTYMFDATPDFVSQMEMICSMESERDSEIVDGVFITHAHIGHYTGLMYLGKEAIDANEVPLYVMPRMKSFLSENGPWDHLVSRKNVLLRELQEQAPVVLSDQIEVTPILVPHRDEYSETVGYRIKGPNKSALFIPDIDKWDRWEMDIVTEVEKVDYAFLDATFYSGKEINNRDISEIPHPFVIESFETFDGLSLDERGKIVFIHFNHTNPLLDLASDESQVVLKKGYKIGKVGDVFEL